MGVLTLWWSELGAMMVAGAKQNLAHIIVRNGFAMDQIATPEASAPCNHLLMDAIQDKQNTNRHEWVFLHFGGLNWHCKRETAYRAKIPLT